MKVLEYQKSYPRHTDYATPRFLNNQSLKHNRLWASLLGILAIPVGIAFLLAWVVWG